MKGTSRKLYGVQALRGLAAILVLIYHLTVITLFIGSNDSLYILMRDWFKSVGSLGVEIFFVISGFIIANSVFSKNTVPVSHFIQNRIIRIYPPYLLYSLVALGILALSANFNNADINWAWVIKSLFLWPTFNAEGKFYPMLFVGWTLVFEAYFYLLFTVMLAARLQLNQLIVAFAGVFLVGHYLAFIFDLGAWGYLLSSEKLWLFWLGVIVYKYYSITGFIDKHVYYAASCLIVLALIMAYLTNGYLKYFFVAIISVSGLIIAIGRDSKEKLSSFTRYMSHIGNSSFTLYLYHSLVIMIITAFWKRGIFAPDPDNASIYIALLTILLTAFSLPLYWYIEKPITSRDTMKRFFKRS